MASGRPTTYNEYIAARVCELIASSSLSVKKLAAIHDWFPDHSTIYLWCHKHPIFSDQYAQARRAQMNVIMDDLDSVVEDSLGYYVDDKGNKKIDPPSASVAIAKANNQKWYASKLAPKLYGDQRYIDELKGETEALKAEVMALRAQLDEKNKREY